MAPADAGTEVVEGVDEHRKRLVALELRGPSAQHECRFGSAAVQCMRQQARLSDPGLAVNQQCAALAGADRGDHVVEQGALRTTPVQRPRAASPIATRHVADPRAARRGSKNSASIQRADQGIRWGDRLSRARRCVYTGEGTAYPMVEVGRFDTRAQAEFARTLLAAGGIPCVLAPDEGPGTFAIDLSGGARVLVADADADDAVLILRRHAPDS